MKGTTKTKRLVGLVLAVLMLFSFTACARTDEHKSGDTQELLTEEKTAEKSLEQKYADAQVLLTENKLEEAAAAFAEIENYMDSSKYVMYIKAVLLAEGGQYESALRCFEALGEFKDSRLMGIYYTGRNYEDTLKYGEAEDRYRSVETFRDSGQRLAELSVKAWTVVGSTVNFGHYEQDNDWTNGKEEIKWLVLDVDEANDRVLLISRYALDRKPYNEELENITWENCTLREWLNNDFKNAAFTEEELAKIPTVTVPAHKNPSWSTNPGNDTQDKIFLLSITEVNQYFKNDDARKAAPTAYAKAQGVSTGWWLRSPGADSDGAADVDYYGGVTYNYVNNVGYSSNAVRPALWVNLAS